MRRIALILLFVLALTASAGAASTARPSLRMTSLRPLVVQGRFFKSAERVRLTLTAKGLTERRRVVATRRGSFTTGFGDLPLGHCAGFAVRAVGSGGSIALLKRPPLPACMPD